MRRGGLVLLVLLVAAPLASGGDGAPPESPQAYDGAFLPTADLRVPSLLAAHPEYDGRGVVIAVLDTGVDPGHPRLATTSTGESKIVDLLDATDDGILDTSLPLEAEGGVVTGATGRVLNLGAHAKPGDPATLGRIDARTVLPEGLVARLEAKRRARHEEAVRRRRDAAACPASGAPAASSEDDEACRPLVDDVPAFDVLVVRRDDGPQVVIDTDGDGDLAEERPIGDYAKAHEWVTLHDDVEMNVAVRPDADGRHVRLLFDGGGHGTHVAGIAAGWDGPGSTRNGVAPGARILSIKVGNSRWGGPTTNLAILRALEMAGQRGAKVVNLSFGGPSFTADAGTPDARGADEAIERYGMTCCFSAGNEGPALSTVGSPATARRAISVGAYVSPATMKVSYAQIGPDRGERLFGFSSRGPLPGGDVGVSVVAPGAAWSSLPCWHLVCGDNWNGTSMAAPEVAGVAALLLSGAAKEGVPASPARVKRALEATARPVPGLSPVEQGAGLVQADAAWQALARMKCAPEERPVRARVVSSTGVGGGVYERGATEPFERRVRLTVDWPRDAGNDARAGFERRLVLTSDRPWAQVPPRVALNADGGAFAVLVDPRGLAPGLHVALVFANDPSRPADGPEVVVPVTLAVPDPVDAHGAWRGTVAVAAGERTSRYLRVPFGAAVARMRVESRGERRTTVTAALSSVDGWRRPDDRGAGARWDLAPGQEREVEVRVVPGTVLEAVLFCHWNAEEPASLDVEVSFHGPTSPDEELRAGPGEDVVALRLATPLAAFRGRVEARITQVVERPEVTKAVAEDPAGPVLGRDPLFVSTQRFRLRIARGDSVRVVPLGTRALDEQREDARWRVVDANGRWAKRGLVDGPFDVDGLAAGDYEVVYETPTWGRAAADAGLTGFEVRRSRPEAGATVYPTADLAADGQGADAGLDLPEGSVRTVAIRLPALDAGRIYGGVVEVKDDRDRVRLSIPLLVDRRTDADPSPAAAEDRLVASLRAAAESVASEPRPSAAALGEAIERAKRAGALRPADRDLAVLSLRLAVKAAGDKAAADPLLERADALRKDLDRAKPDDRPRLGRVLAARAALRRIAGAPADGAASDLVEARILLGEGDPDVLAERVRRGSLPGGDAKDALAAAKALRDADPSDFAAAQAVVDLLLDQHQGVAAGQEVRGWRERFPTRTRDLISAARRVRAAGGDPAPRTLAAIERGEK